MIQQAAKEILAQLQEARDVVTDTKESRHLLDLFESLLSDDEWLDDEAYFLEHGHPKKAEGISLATLFAPLPDGPLPPG